MAKQVHLAGRTVAGGAGRVGGEKRQSKSYEGWKKTRSHFHRRVVRSGLTVSWVAFARSGFSERSLLTGDTVNIPPENIYVNTALIRRWITF